MNYKPIISSVTAATSMMLCAFVVAASPQTTSDRNANTPIAGKTLPAETLREGRFRILDLNGDNYLTTDEIGDSNPVLKSQFSSLDWNNDGKLSEPEYVLNGRPK